MFNVNTIEFNGDKAVINSYSQGYAVLDDSCSKQLAEWSAACPNAIVRTEQMSETDCVALVSAGRAKEPKGWRGGYSHAWTVRRASQL
jgi:hypothetical protein